MNLRHSHEPLHVSSSDLAGSQFLDVNLASARFDDVNLRQAAFDNVNLSRCTFANVNLTGTAIIRANLTAMTIDGVLVGDLLAAFCQRVRAVLFAKDLAAVASFYQHVLGLTVQHADCDHVVLAAPGRELLLHRIPPPIAATFEIASPPEPRAEAAVKLVFDVADLDTARELARRHGGQLFARDREWQHQGSRICDGVDPEGNVVQLRARGADAAEHCG